MSVIINGTTGVSGVDGSASAPAIQGNDTNTGIFFPAADTIAFAQGGTEIARFDSSGNLGIGTNSPTVKLQIGDSTVATSNRLVFGKSQSATESNLPAIGQKSDGVGNDIAIAATSTSGGIRFFTGASTNSGEIGTGSNTECASIDSSGNFSFNSGYGSAAKAYGCRAWVNFQGNANSNQSATYSQSGTTVTVTATAHGLITGNLVYLSFTSGLGTTGSYTVTVTDANTFTVQQTSRTTSGAVNIIKSTIRASGNVSSVADNATGDYVVNFSTAMPDTNYAAVASGRLPTASNVAGECYVSIGRNGTYSTTAVGVQYTGNSTVTARDAEIATVLVFR